MRQGSEDRRFRDYFGTIQSIVTSTGNNDSGLFETNLRDERPLPFEGAGIASTWRLELPADYHTFDYNTISDVILHILYTARPGVDRDKVKETMNQLFAQQDKSTFKLLFNLRHDFPTEWAALINAKGVDNFKATIRNDYFPYFAQPRNNKLIPIIEIHLYEIDGNSLSSLEIKNATFADNQLDIPLADKFPNAKSNIFLVASYKIE